MSGKVLFACSKCFSRHKFEELSEGQQLCKGCRGSSSSVVKCAYCRSEFQPTTAKSQSACKKCEHSLSKYGKPSACECCKIVAAFGSSSKCLRCAGYEAKYGPPVQCDECKQRSAFDKQDENKKVNGKLLCWLCTCAFKRVLVKAQQEGRLPSTKKRPYEKSNRDSSAAAAKKSSRSAELAKGSGGGAVASAAGLDVPEKISRSGGSGGGGGGGGGGNGSGNGLTSIAAPAVISIDPNSADHVVAVTNLKERIASLERRLQYKDKELLEKDKSLTELKGKNFEKENEMRNKLKEIDRIHEMKVENLNRKVTTLLKEIAGLKRSSRKNGSSSAGANVGTSSNSIKEKERIEKRENLSPKEELLADETREKDEKDDIKEEKQPDDDADDKESVSSGSNSPSTN